MYLNQPIDGRGVAFAIDTNSFKVGYDKQRRKFSVSIESSQKRNGKKENVIQTVVLAVGDGRIDSPFLIQYTQQFSDDTIETETDSLVAIKGAEEILQRLKRRSFFRH